MCKFALPRRPVGAVGFALILLACVGGRQGHDSFKVDPGTDSVTSQDDTAIPADTSPSDDTSLPSEICNGIDDDGNGLIDEGFPDVDLDGVADCVDDSCSHNSASAVAIAEPHTCDPTIPPPVAPWEMEVAWEWADDVQCARTVVGDLDADGIPEIVCSGERLVVLSGLDGSVEWTSEIAGEDSGLALVDLDGDGKVEVVVYSDDGGIVAFRSDGSLDWSGTAPLGPSHSIQSYAMLVETGDLDGDGSPEVVGNNGVASGTDGSLMYMFDTPSDESRVLERDIAMGDVDLDGVMDIVTFWERFDATGATVWENSRDLERSTGAEPVLLNADADDEAEILWVATSENVLFDTDGSEVWRQSVDADYPSEPCAGDLDGDGTMEVVYADRDSIVALRSDGSTLWTHPRVDATFWYTACTTFDFDLDGKDEVLTVDESAMYLIDGATGDDLFVYDDWETVTYGDDQIVADLDGDGSVEILLTNPLANDDDPDYVVLRNVNRDWPPGSTMWPTQTWSGVSVLPDGRVPRTPDPSWLTTKKFRGQPEWIATGFDTRVSVTDGCVASCEDDGVVQLAVHLEDLGPEELEDFPVAVYGMAEDGSRSLLSVARFEWVDNSASADDAEVTTTTAQARRGLVLVAGDDGTGTIDGRECNAADNTTTWTLTSCG